MLISNLKSKLLVVFFVFFGLIAIAGSRSVFADNGHYLIDFGDTPVTSTTGWTSLPNGAYYIERSGGYPVVDSTGASTDVRYHMITAFCAYNDAAGNTAGSSVYNYPASATQDFFFTGTCLGFNYPAVFSISGLDQNKTYTFRFYGSRAAAGTRNTDYVINNATTTLNAAGGASPSGNIDNVAQLTGIVPSSGTVTVYVSASLVANGGSTAGYINVLEIIGVANNQNPTADAGIDQIITLPTNNVTINGSGTDQDGTISSYAWTDISNSSSTIASPNSQTTNINNLTVGTHTFRLTVTDNNGGTDTDDIQITVQPQNIGNCPAKKVVFLGSSTAAGSIASSYDKAWAGLYDAYLKQLNAQNTTNNLAYGGYTSYKLLPTSSTPPADRPSPDAAKNITAALALNPDAIILNLPGNDIGTGYSVDEVKTNFITIYDTAMAAHVPIWFTTTQPNNFMDAGQMSQQEQLRDWVISRFGTHSLDFWTTVAEENGNIVAQYEADFAHLNDAGHHILYSRVASSNLLTAICDAVAPSAPSFDVVSSPTGGSINLNSTGTDDVEVLGMKYFVDSTLLNQSTSSPFLFTWDSTGILDGSHILSAVIFDSGKNYATSSQTISIQNDAPSITEVSASTTSSGATIFWTTGSYASSKVDYGLTDSYGQSTNESDTGSGVTSHEVSLLGLSACTTYHYRVRSRSFALNETVDSDKTFTTSGCATPVEPVLSSSGSRRRSGSFLTYVNGVFMNILPIANKANQVSFYRDLQTGYIGDDVRELQIYLNSHGFIVSKSGPGSPGNETTKFGALTRAALVRFQIVNNIKPSIGYFGPKTRGFISSNF